MERQFSVLSKRVIGCAIEVHKALGPGLLESTYRACLSQELSSQQIAHKTEYPLAVRYKDLYLDCGYRIDLFVDDRIIIELKSVDKLIPVHDAQLLTYLKLANINQGFLMNFNVRRLRDGLKSFVL
jgi:GxxExxY protein